MPRKILSPATLANHEKHGTTLAVTLPETGFVRLSTILQVLPIGRSTWWQWVKTGKAPAGIKIGPNTTAWDVASIRALLAQFQQPQG